MRRAANRLRQMNFWAAFAGIASVLSLQAGAQVPDNQRSTVSPPINHESGRIDQVMTASDAGYRFRGYVLTWRVSRIVVAGPPGETAVAGGNLDIVAYRTEVAGNKVLRFEAGSSAANEELVDGESAGSSASMTLGTAPIEETVSADSDGYRFIGYFVTWHDQRVFVVDPKSGPVRSPGETLNFRVWRSGFGENQRLSFSL
jgi:hypothetical protein